MFDQEPTFQRGGEECPLPQLRDRQFHITRGRQRCGPGALEVGVTLRDALERGGADARGRFSINRLLIELLGRNATAVGDVDEFQLGKQVKQAKQCRLDKSYRGLCPSWVV